MAIPNTRQKPGFLGVKYAPLNTGSTPQKGRPFSVRGIALANGLTISDVEKGANKARRADRRAEAIESLRHLKPGDVMRLGVEGLGEQRQEVKAWEDR